MALKPKMLPYLGRLCGAIGVVLWISTPLTYILSDEMGPLLLGKMFGGTFLCLVYLLTNRGFLGRILGARSSGLFAMSVLSSVLVLGLVAGANVFAAWHPWEIDLTREKLYTLSDQTLGVLQRLDAPLQAQAFYSSTEPLFSGTQEILARYAQHSHGMLQVALIDPQNRPDLVEKYQLTERGPRIVLSRGDKDVRVRDPEEQALTQALIKVTTSGRKRLYFLQGHGEGDLDLGEAGEGFKQLADALTAEAYELASLNFKNMPAPESQAPTQASANNPNAGAAAHVLQVPADADLLVILGPQHALLAPEVAAIRAYLAGGGRLLALLEPHKKTGLRPLLASFGITPRDDLIIDPSPLSRLMGLGAASPVIELETGDHPLMRRGAAPLILSTVQSLDLGDPATQKSPAVGLGHAGESAWGETQLAKDGTAARDLEDNLPPLVVAAAAEQPTADGPPVRVLVVGDADWLSNRYLSMQGNQDFALNLVNWATEQEEKISIRPRSRATARLYLSGAELSRLKFYSMDLLPVLLMAFGLAIVLIRRQR
jgi:ABC-type uncharacterized transport system involved in gliding motility auxiliary subunit